MRDVVFGLAVCLALTVSGCSQGNHEVSGKVLFDGQPLSDGYIAYVPEGSGQGGGSNITNGNYSLKTLAGKYKVEITASKMMQLPPGQLGMNGEKEEVRQYIPNRYNAASELTAEVPTAGSIDFDLKSQ